MSIKGELNNLKERDIWSFLLFALFKIRNVPEYSGLSELAYILDKQNLINLCEYFGGLTITIPKVEDLEILLYALLVYQYTHVDKIDVGCAFNMIKDKSINHKEVRDCYHKIAELLNDYDFVSRSV